MRRLIGRLADTRNPRSLGTRFRRRRFRLFEELISDLPRPVRVLDAGGTQRFWENIGYAGRPDLQVTLLNLRHLRRPRHANITVVQGSATEMPFPDHAFPVVISNSVIEHLGDLGAQRRMAEEVRRVGRLYYVQTPNRYFPIEPHFYVPFMQFLPFDRRASMIRRMKLGSRGRRPGAGRALKLARSIRLMTARELEDLFPGSRVRRELFLGLTKSFVVTGGTLGDR